MAETNNKDEVFNITIFEDQLMLKNNLIWTDVNEFKERFSNIPYYISFLADVAYLLRNEPEFLFLSKEFLQKIRDTIDVHRFDLSDEQVGKYSVSVDDIHGVTNAILMCLNTIDDATPVDRKEIIVSYMAYQEQVRNFKFEKVEDFTNTLAYDAAAYFTLVGKIDTPIEPYFMMASLGYFLEETPEIFLNKKVLDKALKVIEKVHKKTKITDITGKILAKRLKEELNSLKEE